MTQHAPQNNRNTTNTNVYSHKRGTQTRVSRVKVTTVGKTPFPEKQHRSCPRCKESTNSMKLLNARVEKIEQLVDVLAKTTRGLASMSKREDRFAQSALKFRGIDLTRCTLQELQKLVVATTNIMAPSSTNNTNISKKVDNTNTDTTNTKKTAQNPSKDTTLTDITTTTNNEIFHSEPISMEDIKITGSRELFKEPMKTVVASLKQAPPRQDSGYDSGGEQPTHGGEQKKRV